MRSLLRNAHGFCFFLCAIICTISLFFGAVHPIVQSVYSAAMLVGCGGWLLFPSQPEEMPVRNWSCFWGFIPIVLICFLLLQRLPLPIGVVEQLSPLRAERIAMVNQLAGTHVTRIPLSYNNLSGMTQIVFFFALLLYYAALKKCITAHARCFALVVWCLIGVGVVEALYGLMQFAQPHIGILWLPLTAGRAAHGTIIYKNQYASLLNMLWPMTLAGSIFYSMGNSSGAINPQKREVFQDIIHFTATAKLQTFLLFLATVIICLAELFSLSRGGILTMLFLMLFLIIVFPFSGRKKAIFLTCFFLLLVGYTSLVGMNTLWARLDSISEAGNNIRFSVYRLSLPIIREHWLTGTGLGSYTLLSPLYLKGFPVHVHFDRVHNEYIELFIELGIPMATLLFVWIMAGMIRLLRAIVALKKRTKQDQQAVVLAIAAFAGIFGFLVHGCIDFGWRLPANLVYVVTLLAIASACVQRGTARGGRISVMPSSCR